jgi:hypothetical protein
MIIRQKQVFLSLGERMFGCRHMFAQRAAAALALAALLATAGCGGADGTTTAEPPADSGDVAVIEGWAKALAAGDERAAAGYFAIPSTAENGPLLTSIDTRADAVAFNRSLPCGAEVVSAQTTGELTTATFRLSDRPGGDCGSGAGATASTTFDIEGGKIVEWLRVDDAPPPGSVEGEGTEI